MTPDSQLPGGRERAYTLTLVSTQLYPIQLSWCEVTSNLILALNRNCQGETERKIVYGVVWVAAGICDPAGYILIILTSIQGRGQDKGRPHWNPTMVL